MRCGSLNTSTKIPIIVMAGIILEMINWQAVAFGAQRLVEASMADQRRPTGKAIVHDSPESSIATPAQAPAASKPQKLDRTLEQLRPLAERVAKNEAIMLRFYQARGSDNEELARKTVDEIRNYAQTLDPTVSYTEGAAIVLALELMFPRGL